MTDEKQASNFNMPTEVKILNQLCTIDTMMATVTAVVTVKRVEIEEFDELEVFLDGVPFDNVGEQMGSPVVDPVTKEILHTFDVSTMGTCDTTHEITATFKYIIRHEKTATPIGVPCGPCDDPTP